MSVKSTAIVSLTLAAGAALGWFLRDALQAAGTPARADRVGARSEASDDEGLRGPRLAGTPTGERPAGADLGLATVERHAIASLREGGHGFEALALLYALSGREEDFLELVAMGLDSGVDPDRVLDAIRDLPLDRQVAVLERVLAAHPDADFSAYDVARIFERAGAPARALEVVRAEVPRRGELSRGLTRLLLRLDPEGGPALLLQASAEQAWGEDTLAKLRGLLAEAGRDDALVPFLDRALEADPTDADALRMLGGVDREAALARVRGLLARDPADAELWALVGEWSLAGGDRDAAFDAMSEAARLSPTGERLEALLSLDAARALPLIEELAQGQVGGDLTAALVDAYLHTGARDRALEILARAHEADPRALHWIDGMIAVDPRRAIAAIQVQIAVSPASASEDLLGRYADALAAAGHRDEAFEQYLAAHRKDRGDHQWQLAMAETDPRRAVSILEPHVRSHPDDASGLGAYGVALAGAGRKDEAVAHLEHAIAEGNARLWYGELAEIEPERALGALRARAEDDDDEDLWGALGRALEGQGRRAEAEAAYREAIALDPAGAEWVAALRALR
jgi:tetratricopeptide (TPR) repeat protein